MLRSAHYILILAIFNVFEITIFANEKPKVPPVYERFLEIDQKFNIRKKAVSGEVVPVYAYDLEHSSDKITAVARHEIEDRQSLINLGIIDQEIYPSKRRVFTLMPDKYLGDPVKVFNGTKMLSTSSYFVWNPDNKTNPPFIVKFKKYGDFNGLIISTLLKQHLKENDISFIPEIGYTLWKKFDGKTVGNTIRSADFMKTLPNLELYNYPLHGFLGAKLYDVLAKHSGYIDDNKWLKDVYAVQLGKWMATLNFKYGLFPAAHTQNLVIQVNMATGSLSQLILKDLSDVSVDPFLWKNHTESETPLLATFLANQGPQINLVNHDFWYGKYIHPGDYLATYFGQSIIQAAQGATVDERIDITTSFLRSYIEQVEKIMNIDLVNNPKIINGIMKQNNLDKISYTVLAIYNRVVDQLLPPVKELHFPENQNPLKKRFFKEVKRYNASYFDHKTSNKIRKGRISNIVFGIHQSKIYAVNKKTKTVVAMVHLNHYPWDEVNVPKPKRKGLGKRVLNIGRQCIELLTKPIDP